MAKTKKKKVEVAPLRASTEIVITESGCFERETIIKRVIPTEKLIQSLQGNVIISTPLLPTNEKGGCIQFEKCEGQHITFKFRLPKNENNEVWQTRTNKNTC